MPDFAMCPNDECPSRGRCRRFMAQPGRYQSFMDFRPEPGQDRCESFDPVAEDSDG